MTAAAGTPAQPAGIALRTLVAAGVLCVLLGVTSGVATSFVAVPDTGASAARMLASLFVVCLVDAAVLVYALLRMNGAGTGLAATLFVLHFGIASFMTQNETLYFNTALEVPRGVVWGHLVSTAVSAALFAPFLVWWFGRTQPAAPEPSGLGVTRAGLAWKVAVVACLVYPALYLLFGHFVLWQVEAARLLYHGSTELTPFLDSMARVFRDDPWLLPWQCLRGLLWVALAGLVMRSSRAGWAETGVLVGLLFALLMNVQHLIPNPYMPPIVQLAHFVETSVSNFILGFATVWILRP